MSSLKIARRYAKSLIASAVASGSVDAVSADMATVRSTIDASKELQAMMRSPVVTHSLKKSVIDELFSAKVSPLTLSFLHLLIEKGRGDIWRDVADEVNAQIDTIGNVQRVAVTSAADLSSEERTRIEGALSKSLGRIIVATYSVDASIIGGAVIRIGDQVHDGSLRHQLAVLGKQLTQA